MCTVASYEPPVRRERYVSAMSEWSVRQVRDDEFDAWTRLYRGYAAFYETPTSDAHQRQIWSWIHDDRSIECLVAVPVDGAGNEVGEPQGLAHLREWMRPLRGRVAGYLDDLFVDPAHRGAGAVDALFDAMARLALERNWAVIRWTTADDNYRARAVYDRLADRTTWITYDMTPEADGPVDSEARWSVAPDAASGRATSSDD